MLESIWFGDVVLHFLGQMLDLSVYMSPAWPGVWMVRLRDPSLIPMKASWKKAWPTEKTCAIVDEENMELENILKYDYNNVGHILFQLSYFIVIFQLFKFWNWRPLSFIMFCRSSSRSHLDRARGICIISSGIDCWIAMALFPKKKLIASRSGELQFMNIWKLISNKIK